MAGVEILEGFLCPICVQDLGSVVNLQDHFEIAHSAEDRALLNQLKGWLVFWSYLKLSSECIRSLKLSSTL